MEGNDVIIEAFSSTSLVVDERRKNHPKPHGLPVVKKSRTRPGFELKLPRDPVVSFCASVAGSC